MWADSPVAAGHRNRGSFRRCADGEGGLTGNAPDHLPIFITLTDIVGKEALEILCQRAGRHCSRLTTLSRQPFGAIAVSSPLRVGIETDVLRIGFGLTAGA